MRHASSSIYLYLGNLSLLLLACNEPLRFTRHGHLLMRLIWLQQHALLEEKGSPLWIDGHIWSLITYLLDPIGSCRIFPQHNLVGWLVDSPRSFASIPEGSKLGLRPPEAGQAWDQGVKLGDRFSLFQTKRIYVRETPQTSIQHQEFWEIKKCLDRLSTWSFPSFSFCVSASFLLVNPFILF